MSKIVSKDSQEERIKCFLRVRPLNPNELRGKDSIAVTMDPATPNEVTLNSRLANAPNKSYKLDKVFSENSDQKQVYDSVVGPAVKQALAGYNSTVFAYGQTGTGKTFTMEGGLEGGAAWSADHADSGMIPRAVRDVFAHLQNNMDTENSVRVSHLELFNEELIDLLGSSADEKPLRLFDHPKEGVTVHNLEHVPVTSADAIFKILRKSSIRRHEAATRLNASSSRSHCVFTITIQTKEQTSDNGELIRVGRLHLVDLAGSENVAKTGLAGGQKRESGAINQSLLVLGRVITAVSENRAHIPYRESKLTRLMADAIGGKNKTSMIACITMAGSSYDETQATLEYAISARRIKNKPEVNSKITKKAVIKEYLHEIERLKMQVNAAREKNGVYLSPEEFKELQEQLKTTQEKVTKLESELTNKAKQLDDTTSLFETASEKLRDTSETLKVTEANLEDTRVVLSDTQSTLEQTQDTLEENCEVIRHQQETEKVLFKNANVILDTLDVREADVEGLHAKIDRKTAVEDENRAISADFRQYVGGKVEDMTTQLQRFRDTQTEQLMNVKSTVYKFMEEKTSDMDKLCEKLDSLQDMLQTAIGSMSAAVSNHTEETIMHLGTVEETAMQGRSRISDSLTQFSVGAEKAVEQWRVELGDQRSQVTDWGVNTSAALQMLLAGNDEWSAEHSSNLNELKASLESNTQAHVAWTEAHRQSIQTALKEHKDRTEKMQREMTRQISDLVSSYVVAQQNALATNVKSLQEKTSKQVKQLAEQHEARSKTINTVLCPNVDNRATKLQKEFSALAEQVEAHQSASEERVESDQVRADAWQSSVEATQEQMTQLSEAADVRLAEDLENMSEQANTNHASMKNQLEDNMSSNAAWRDEATEFAMVSRSSIEETQMAVEAKIKGLEQHTQVFGDKLQSEMSGVQDQFYHYFDSLHEDAPTGSTPQKRVLPHPTTLPRCAPEEEILQKFSLTSSSGSMEAATPMARMSLPASPSDFADFAPSTASKASDVTPVQHHSSRPSIQHAATSSKVEDRKKRISDRSSSAADAKRAAVKANRQKQISQSTKKMSNGPQRTALSTVTNHRK